MVDVLKCVTGILKPGLNALIGPTGSGKTSLMDILAGRIDPTNVVGTVLVDGKEPPHDFHRYAGYVCQDDFAISVLTVRENLNFSAALRLPAWTTKRDREDRVESLLKKLGLTSVADSKVGDESTRGISGGERKRTNIGIELITEPCVIFLDEPTTGLDAHTAMVVMQVLKRLALEGRTIITSIHQPKSSIYKLFDSLTLLANGRIVYHGAAGDSPVSYFRRLGYKVSDHENPADFFIDLLHTELPKEAQECLNVLYPSADGTRKGHNQFSDDNSMEKQQVATSDLLASRLQCVFYSSYEWLAKQKPVVDAIFSTWRRLSTRSPALSREGSLTQFQSVHGSEAELHPLVLKASPTRRSVDDGTTAMAPISQQPEQHTIVNNALLLAEGAGSESDMLDDTKHVGSPVSKTIFSGGRSQLPFYRQFGILSKRGFLSTVRNFNGAAVYLIACSVFSLLLGFVYLKLDTSKESGIQNRLGLFFFVCLQVIFFNTNCVEVFIRDFARFRQERFKGYYCTSAYFLSKVFCEVLPVRVFPVIVFLPMLYLMAGLKSEISAIVIWELVWLATSTASCGVAILTGVVFNHLELASLFTCLVYSCMMAFSGYLLNMVSTWRVLSWLRYLSIFWYAFSAQSINELTGVEFCSLAKLSSSQQHSWAMSGVDFVVPDDGAVKNSTSSRLQSCVSGSEYLENQGIPFGSPWSLWSNILGLGCISFFTYLAAYIRLRLLRNYVS
ncbi:hypothetical protein AAHC03_0991 [Spirometra sp. Aus1]